MTTQSSSRTRALSVLAALAISLFLYSNALAQCGLDRWPIKTLGDAGAATINYTEVAGSVTVLSPKVRPFSGWLNAPRHASEKVTYNLPVRIVMTGRESAADRDYHIVVKGPTGTRTMVCEIPDPNCPDMANLPAATRAKFTAARAWIDANVGVPPTSITALSTPVRARMHGVAFWEKKNHGTGHSIGGLELHPVYLVEGR